MAETNARIAAIMHNVRELRYQTAAHTGESSGNLDVLERRIEDGVRELAGLAPVQPEFPVLATRAVPAAPEDALPSVGIMAAYLCPAGCGCVWRDNRDGSMSLMSGQEKSCGVCEFLPLAKLTKMDVADHLFIDDRGDGVWLVCLGKVHSTMEDAQRECRAWQRAAATAASPNLGGDAARLDWLESQSGVNLVSDDGERWAVSDMGVQPVPQEGGFKDTVWITAGVMPSEWHTSIRAAIDAAISGDKK